MTRTQIEGPAVIVFDSATYYTEGTITLTPDLTMHEIMSSYYGPVDRRVTDKVFNLAFTPVGMFSIAAAKYFPYGILDLGKTIAPATDAPVEIYTAGGQKISFPAGVISKSPTLNLGIGMMPMGPMGIACMGDLTKVDAAADCHYTISTAAIAAHSLDPSKIVTPAYHLTLTPPGESPTVVTLDSEDGFVFDTGAALTARKVNAYGTVNYKLTAFKPTITFTPYGKTEVEMMTLLNIQGASAARLGFSNKLGYALSLKPVTDGDKGVTIAFSDCQLESGSMLFGATDPRHGKYAIVPSMAVVVGVPQALYSITFPTWA